MALPTSGPLSFSAIAGELGVSLSNVSLRNMSSQACFSIPDAVSEFYGYSNIDIILYFVVRNKVSRLGSYNTREIRDGGAYELYEKPNSNNTNIDDYDLVDSSNGDSLLSYSNGRWLTDIFVTINCDDITIDIKMDSKSTRDKKFYITLIENYLKNL